MAPNQQMSKKRKVCIRAGASTSGRVNFGWIDYTYSNPSIVYPSIHLAIHMMIANNFLTPLV